MGSNAVDIMIMLMIIIIISGSSSNNINIGWVSWDLPLLSSSSNGFHYGHMPRPLVTRHCLLAAGSRRQHAS
jgi:hypothetical protein